MVPDFEMTMTFAWPFFDPRPSDTAPSQSHRTGSLLVARMPRRAVERATAGMKLRFAMLQNAIRSPYFSCIVSVQTGASFAPPGSAMEKTSGLSRGNVKE